MRETEREYFAIIFQLQIIFPQLISHVTWSKSLVLAIDFEEE